MTANEALQAWIKTQSLPVSSIEEHGFINGYEWAMDEVKIKLDNFGLAESIIQQQEIQIRGLRSQLREVHSHE